MSNAIIKFFKYFITKYFGTVAIEKIMLITLQELVKRTDSKIDDQIYHAIFHETQEYEKCDKCKGV